MAQQNTSEEIDLGYLFKKSNDFIRSFVRAIFQVLAFYVKYWIILLVLVLLGWGYGYYVDSNSKKTYINEGIVIPNFESVDYLYKNINFLNNKIRQNDTTFLKNVFPSGYDRVNAIERSEEHTSELHSRPHLVCRLLLEKKKKPDTITPVNVIVGMTDPALSTHVIESTWLFVFP